MDVRIGRVTFTAEGGEGYGMGSTDLCKVEPFAAMWDQLHLFDWDCATQAGRPTPPPESIRVPFAQYFHLTDAKGDVDAAASKDLAERVRQRLGCADLAAMAKLFDAAFPSVEVKVPTQGLYQDHRPTHRFQASYMVEWAYLILRAAGLRPGDHVILGIAERVTFLKTLLPVCIPGADPTDRTITGTPQAVDHAELAGQLLEQRDQDREAWQRQQREERGG